MVKQHFFILLVCFCYGLLAHDKDNSHNPFNSFRIEKGASCTVSIVNNSSTSSSLPIVEISQSTENDQKNDQKNNQVSNLLNIIENIHNQLTSQDTKLNTIQDHQTTHSNQLKTIQDQIGQSLENLQEQKSNQLQLATNIQEINSIFPVSLLSSDNNFNLIEKNKFAIGFVGIIFCYSYISYQIYTRNKIIEDPLAWANWHNDKKIQELLALPAAQLQAELLYDFQHRYIDPADPMNFMYSIAQSSAALEREIQLIKKQIFLYQSIIKSRCGQLFFINSQSIFLLEEKQRKLAFIKHIFSSWCAQSKIEKNK